MPTYKITAPDGRVLRVTGDAPPNEGQLAQIFEQHSSNLANKDIGQGNQALADAGVPIEPLMMTDDAKDAAIAGTAAASIPLSGGLGIPALAARPALTAALTGALAGGIEHGPKGALVGGLTGGVFTKGLTGILRSSLARRTIGKLFNMVPAAKAAEAAADPNLLSSAEARRIVQNLAKAEPGAVMNPSVEEVAERMIPKGELPPLSRAEMARIVKGASPSSTPVKAVGQEMSAAGQVKPFTQGEMTTVTRGVSKAPEGFIENPSAEMVAELMQPRLHPGVDSEVVALLRKSGFTQEQAIQVAKAAIPNPAKVLAPSSAGVTVPTVASAPTLAERQAKLLAEAGAENPFAVAAQEIPDRLAGTGHGSGATVEEILESLKRAQKIQKALETSGKTVIAP